jgi:hypothetical protein
MSWILRCQTVLLTLAAALFGASAAAQQPSIVGTWDWTRKSNNCAEQYVFRRDGTVLIKSGDERLERTYLMAWSPEPTGRYKVTLTTVKDSGGRGCADAVETATARQGTVYVLFGGSRATMLVCNSPSEPDCIGPLRKAE